MVKSPEPCYRFPFHDDMQALRFAAAKGVLTCRDERPPPCTTMTLTLRLRDNAASHVDTPGHRSWYAPPWHMKLSDRRTSVRRGRLRYQYMTSGVMDGILVRPSLRDEEMTRPAYLDSCIDLGMS